MIKSIKAALLACLFLAFGLPAYAAPATGITTCSITAQPADLTFSAVSANRLLSATCGETVIVFNNSASDARFRTGTVVGTTALTTDMLLPANTFIVLNVGRGTTYFAAIGAGGGTISFIQGTAN